MTLIDQHLQQNECGDMTLLLGAHTVKSHILRIKSLEPIPDMSIIPQIWKLEPIPDLRKLEPIPDLRNFLEPIPDLRNFPQIWKWLHFDQ